MGIYLGQLPPAEIARLKAELAETLIANFCYPRFFDHRTESLRMRPVDRAKRQEVWLYLSSVDFTAWNRVDLLSPDFQHHIERLFIQFVQRNRSFFGNQGRRRMSDVRMLISTCAASVSQGLRNHLTNQRPPGSVPFGSPRQVVSWVAPGTNGRAELSWEQIAALTMQTQQQLQELRGEVKPGAPSEERAASAGNGTGRRIISRPLSTTLPPVNRDRVAEVSEQPTVSTVSPPRPATSAPRPPLTSVKTAPPASPAASVAAPSATPTAPRRMEAPARPVEPSVAARQSGPLGQPTDARMAAVSTAPAQARPTVKKVPTTPLAEPASSAPASGPLPARGLPQPASQLPANGAITNGHREMLAVGEDDIAIFEQMRHQLLVWLRVEAVSSGLEISGQGPAQLLDMLRQQAHLDETRLQVVSTLLNLSNQVIKTGLVSTLDYKQALMFHLMHTRR